MSEHQELNTALGVGRRKASNAKVRLSNGSGKIYVNGISGSDYFQLPSQSLMLCNKALKIFDVENTYDIFAQVCGGGLNGQMQAIQLAVSNALIKIDSMRRPKLKSLGLLRRRYSCKRKKKIWP